MRDRLLEDFVFAGSSALLISISHLHPKLWFVSLIALIPFLWRIIRASLYESVILGSILATSYCLVTVPITSWSTLQVFSLKLLGLNALLILYAVAVNRVAKCVGSNAIVMALFWLPVEYVLTQYAGFGSMFGLHEIDSALLIRIGSLFGALMASFGIVLVNSFILAAFLRVTEALTSRPPFSSPDEQIFLTIREKKIPHRHWYNILVPRAPPFLPTKSA
jgi:hypothetical protein